MPIYTYKCEQCEHEYEVFYKTFSAVDREESTEKCPECESDKKVRTVNTGTSFQLKGRGWYKPSTNRGTNE